MSSDDDAFRNGTHALTCQRYGDGWAKRKLQLNRETVKTHVMKSYLEMWSKENFSYEVQGNKTPILVIFGNHDNEDFRASANSHLYHQWYPLYSEEIMQTGHYPMMEAPVAYAKIVEDFILK